MATLISPTLSALATRHSLSSCSSESEAQIQTLNEIGSTLKALLFSTIALLTMTTARSQVVEVVPEAVPTVRCTELLNVNDYPVVTYHKDVEYKVIDDTHLHLQILEPRTADGRSLPCVVYVQGSAWLKQNVYQNVTALSRFAERGFVVAIVEYRHTDIAPFPAQLVDSKTAIRFMRKHAKTYHVNPDNMFIWGDSSGGHTSLFIGLTGDENYKDDVLGDVSCSVNATVAYYPPTDISVMKDYPSLWDHDSADSPEGKLIGGDITSHQDDARKASPYYYVSKERPVAPILIATGTRDELVPFSQSDKMVRGLQEAGKQVSFYVLKDATHGSWHFWTEEMFDRVERFLRYNIK